MPFAYPYLVYYHWIDSTDLCGNDYGKVIVDETFEVAVYDLCISQNTGGWILHAVNLNAFSGQSILLRIQVQGNSTYSSHVFVDDVSFRSNDTAAQGMHTTVIALR